MVLLSITPLLDGVLRLDIIAPFHTSGPPLLQFHLAIEQWGYTKHRTTIFFPIAYKLECFGVTPPSGLVNLFYESGSGIGIKDITLTSAYSVGSVFWISAGQ